MHSNPARISGVRSSAQAGHRSPSSEAIAIIPLIDHAAPIRGSFVSTPVDTHEAAVGDQLAGGFVE